MRRIRKEIDDKILGLRTEFSGDLYGSLDAKLHRPLDDILVDIDSVLMDGFTRPLWRELDDVAGKTVVLDNAEQTLDVSLPLRSVLSQQFFQSRAYEVFYRELRASTTLDRLNEDLESALGDYRGDSI